MRTRAIAGTGGGLSKEMTPYRPLNFRPRGPHDAKRKDCAYGTLVAHTDCKGVTGSKGRGSSRSVHAIVVPFREPPRHFRSRSTYRGRTTKALRVTYRSTRNQLPSDHPSQRRPHHGP